jgi:hypothetical protein
MLWIYQRGAELLRVETRFDNDTNKYVLIVYREDGTEREERFENPKAFHSRLLTLQTQLDRERWESDGVRLLRDGWKI